MADLLLCFLFLCYVYFFFFNDTATTEIYTLSLHDALPIFTCGASHISSPRPCSACSPCRAPRGLSRPPTPALPLTPRRNRDRDRKSTRLNSSHANISYAVFCLKKKKTYNA